MSKYLTGNKDLDTEIFLNLNDYELESISKVNKSIRNIYESDIFWYRRIAKRIEYGKKGNLEIYKELINIPIDREGILQTKKYFKLEKLKELDYRLSDIKPPRALYQFYYIIYCSRILFIDKI
jgi:hypothetical protein